MKFNSQICTTIEQSKRLLDLGLKPETADMVLIKELAYDAVAHCIYDADTYMIRPIDYLVGEKHRGHIHAWSLHRLIELCPEYINIDGYADTTYWFKMYKLDNKIIYENDYNRWIYLGDGDNLFDTLIDCIDWAINNKHFNMNYLN